MPTRAAGNLCSAVTADLGRRIVAGRVAPGDVLPPEMELCRSFGVSRTTLREAVKRLHGKGLVSPGPRRGTLVLPTQHWNQFDAEVLAWRVDAGASVDMLDQLYEIRNCFEPRACALAARHATDADRARIAETYTTFADPDVDRERRIAADLDFHMAIFAATGNIFFVSMGAAIRTALNLSFRLTQLRTAIPADELMLHEMVRTAILEGRGAAAETSMQQLLDASRRTLGVTLEPDDTKVNDD